MARIPQAVQEALGYYVYRLVDPRDGKTFYVGKGTGERVLQHGWDAVAADIPTDKQRQINEIRAAGLEELVIIQRYGLNEETAFAIEAALIDVLPGLTNMVAGHGREFTAVPLMDLIAHFQPRQANITVPAILIRVQREWRPDLTPAALYERTRRYWKANPEARRPTPTHALAVANGLVREVYRIERWEEYRSWPEDRDLTREDGAAEVWTEDQNDLRSGFVGWPCPEQGPLLKGCTVGHLLPQGAQNPIAYVDC